MDNGAHFHRCDFQVHTPRDLRWSGPAYVTHDERLEYAARFVAACRKKQLQAVAITDHHDLVFAKYIRDAAANERDEIGDPIPSENRIVVFPGMELTLSVPCQALLIFDAEFPDDLFSLALNALAIRTNDDREAKTANVERLPHIATLVQLKQELDKHDYLKERYIIFPNVSDGGTDTLLRSGAAPKYREMPCVGGYLDGGIEQLGTGNLDILNGRNREYGYKRLALFQTSDNRRDDHATLGTHSTWVKWATPTAEALRQACLAQESRIAQSAPILPTTAITSISISNSAFLGPIELQLNPQYTAFIGGRGTGKSTVLEYMRWGLCDQPPDVAAGGELPNYQERRKSLIDKTLKKHEGTVQIGFTVNGIPHVVRHSSVTREILLKIGDSDFTSCTESDIRSLLPIQAYSQKQLSNVGIRLDELKRFIHAPIRRELDEISRRVSDISTEIRQLHAGIQRKRAIEKAIANDRLSIDSLSRQAELIRKSLTGVSGEDQNIIAQQPAYEQLRLAVDAIDADIVRAIDAAHEFAALMKEFPSLPPAGSGLDAEAIVGRLHENARSFFSSLDDLAGQIEQRLSQIRGRDGAFAGEYRRIRNEWKAAYDRFQENYKAAQGRSSAQQSRLTELQVLEKRISDLQAKVAEATRTVAALGAPESRYADLRDEWQRLHHERADFVEQQCETLTALSDQEIRATLQRGAGVAQLAEALRTAVSGSGLRRDRIESIAANVADAENPIAAWDELLAELELVAEHEVQDGDDEALPQTPLLNACSLTPNDIRKVAFRFTVEAWLELALTQLEDEPVFEYRAREGDYIPFVNASAGQQATSLLKALLHQSGPPLIIDQPEDDLDNPVIFKIVERIWEAKKSRQLIFASHNANLVVNGDAELVVWYDYRTAGDHSRGELKGQGAIDIDDICQAIKKVMEGGEQAFKLRRDKYGF